jgi:hypothetical protein
VNEVEQVTTQLRTLKVPRTIPSHRWIQFEVAYIDTFWFNVGFQLMGWRVSHFGKLGNHDERAACSY